ncbi:ABC transporter ATP-binding protein [Priestia sp. YIM B13490]|uniref:ABC transporter ATP-binding protein n=1 Tax=Priestia sp. YIM B13490 TaxID=3366310 RepID=UPI00366E8EE6
MENNTTAIKISKLGKKFDKSYIFKNLSLEIQKGEVFGFLGRNGAGKSTLINTFTGINRKTEGQFWIEEILDTSLNSIKQSIGVMPDTSNLYQHMTAKEFIKYMSELKSLRYSNSEINNLLNYVGLGATGKRKIKTFSFGMKKKISIAQALLGNPSIIILDEPTSGLDPESALHIQSIIRELKNKNVTVFITSHNMSEIEKVCDRIAIMHKGKIERIGTIAQLRQEFSSKVRINVQSIPSLNQNNIPKSITKKIKILDNFTDKTIIDLANYDDIPIVLNALIIDGFKIYNFGQETVELEEIFLSIE